LASAQNLWPGSTDATQASGSRQPKAEPSVEELLQQIETFELAAQAQRASETQRSAEHAVQVQVLCDLVSDLEGENLSVAQSAKMFADANNTLPDAHNRFKAVSNELFELQAVEELRHRNKISELEAKVQQLRNQISAHEAQAQHSSTSTTAATNVMFPPG
jgi:hypothetical protein